MNDELQQQARRRGVYTSFLDDHGRPVEVSPRVVEATLGALGEDHLVGRTVEPVIVAWDGNLPAVPIGQRLARCTIELEDGRRLRIETVPDADGGRSLTRPTIVPLGYHHLELTPGGERALVIAAPTVPRPWQPEAHWGLLAPVYALRSSRSLGVGDLGDVRTLSDRIAAHGADTVLSLPLLPLFLDPPAEPSPYTPVSRTFWNELYADIDRLPEAASPDVQSFLTSPDVTRLVAELLETPEVDYDRAGALKHEVLARCEATLANHPTRHAALDTFVAGRPEVVEYARFRAVGAALGRNWREWPGEMARGRIDTAAADERLVRLHVYAQFVMQTQLDSLTDDLDAANRFLGLDLALGSHPDGYDVWSNQELFTFAASAGAPPDGFFTGGQDWGFPPIQPEASRVQGHDYIISCVRHHLRSARLLRIDHVMGLHRLYWVPSGHRADEGTYVTYPADELFAIVCLEAHRAEACLIGENLGTVPPEVDAELDRHHMLGTYVAQARIEDLSAGSTMRPPTAATVATVNTHDMPTFAGYWAGHDITDRVDLGLLDPDAAAAERLTRVELQSRLAGFLGVDRDHAGDPAAVLEALLVWLAEGAEPFLIANLEDLWLEEQPQNVPGTYRERPNWLHPARHRVDELDAVPGLGRLFDRIDAARRRR